MKNSAFILATIIIILYSSSILAQAPHPAWNRLNVFASSLTTSADGNTLLLFDPEIIEVWDVSWDTHPVLKLELTPHVFDDNLFSGASFEAAGISSDGTVISYLILNEGQYSYEEEQVVDLLDHSLFGGPAFTWSSDSTLNWVGSRTSTNFVPQNDHHFFSIDSNAFPFESSGSVFEHLLPDSSITRFAARPIYPRSLVISSNDQLIAASMDSTIFLLSMSDGSIIDSVAAGNIVQSIAFNATTTKLALVTNSGIAVYDLVSHTFQEQRHYFGYNNSFVSFVGTTNNVYAAVDSELLFYETTLDTGLWERVVPETIYPGSISKDGSMAIYVHNDYRTTFRYRTSDLTLLDTISERQFGLYPYSGGAIAFATNPDTVYIGTGYYDPGTSSDLGIKLGYSFISDTTFLQIGGSAQNLAANERLLVWQFSNPYNDEGGVYDRILDSTWYIGSSGVCAVGSDTFRSFLTSGIEGITRWTWDNALGKVENNREEANGNISVTPNPSNGKTNFILDFPVPDRVKLTVTDALSRTCYTLFDGELNSGPQQIQFDSKDLPNGIYFVVSNTSTNVQVARFSVLH